MVEEEDFADLGIGFITYYHWIDIIESIEKEKSL